jgi:hypothetical protein
MELLNIEMKKIIKFREVKDPNAFCLAEKKKSQKKLKSLKIPLKKQKVFFYI